MTYGALYGVPVVYSAGNGTGIHSVDVRRTLENLVTAAIGAKGLPAGHHDWAERVAEMAWRAGLSPSRVAAYSRQIYSALKGLEQEHTGGPTAL